MYISVVMSKLFIRQKDLGRFTIFVHTPAELSDLIASYIPGRSILIGDIFMFSPIMRSSLLKFCEDNPTVDCYSSVDFPDPVLYSRFVEIHKAPLNVVVNQSPDDFYKSPRTHLDALQHLGGCPYNVKLLAPNLSVSVSKLLV